MDEIRKAIGLTHSRSKGPEAKESYSEKTRGALGE